MVVTAQMAITVVLLVGAALLGRSLLSVLSVNPGFRTDGIVAMDVTLTSAEDEDVVGKARRTAFYADLFDRAPRDPGCGAGRGHECAAARRRSARRSVSRDDAAGGAEDDAGTGDPVSAEGAAGDGRLRRRVAAYFRDARDPDRSRTAVRRSQSAPRPMSRSSASRWRVRAGPARSDRRDGEFGNMDGDLRPITIGVSWGTPE